MCNKNALAGALVCALSVASAGCDTSPSEGPLPLSRVDQKPVVVVASKALYEDLAHPKAVVRWAAEHGDALVAATQAADKQADGSSAFIPLATLGSGAGKNGTAASASPSSHLVVFGDHSRQDFVLGFERFVSRRAGANKAQQAASVEGTYVALNPDQFYVHEDAQYNEVYPFSIEATALDGSGTGTLTFEGPGVATLTADGATTTDPDVLFLTGLTTPCAELEGVPGGDCPPPDDGGGGDTGGGDTGGGTSDPDPQEGGSGFQFEEYATPDFSTGGLKPYLTLYAVMFSGQEADNSEEIQMYRAEGDDYTKPFRKKRRYDFDSRYTYGEADRYGTMGFNPYRYGPNTVQQSGHTRAALVPGTGALQVHIAAPDLNLAGVVYGFENLPKYYFGIEPGNPSCGSTVACRRFFQHPGEEFATGFPLVYLSDKTYRFFLADNDHVYTEFSTRRSIYRTESVGTFDINGYIPSPTVHNISSNWETYGSSDDIVSDSGIRGVNKYNVELMGARSFRYNGMRYDLGLQYLP